MPANSRHRKKGQAVSGLFDHKSDAWKRGYRDGQRGRTVLECPYIGAKAREWLDGHEQGWNDHADGRNELKGSEP